MKLVCIAAKTALPVFYRQGGFPSATPRRALAMGSVKLFSGQMVLTPITMPFFVSTGKSTLPYTKSDRVLHTVSAKVSSHLNISDK